jgi:hypothetical protein
MVNREYIKTQIDTLPEAVVIGIDKYIARQAKKEMERIKNNAEYLAKISVSLKQLKKGKKITFEIEELEAMVDMSEEETLKLVEKAIVRENNQ